MTCRLLLYLKGAWFISKEITLSDDNAELDDNQNFLIREAELKSAVEVFRIQYYKLIIKCAYEYDIAAVFSSSMLDHDPLN